MSITSGYQVQRLNEDKVWVPASEATTNLQWAIARTDELHGPDGPARVVDSLSGEVVYFPGFEPTPLKTIQFDSNDIAAVSAAIDIAVKYGDLDDDTAAILESVMEKLR